MNTEQTSNRSNGKDTSSWQTDAKTIQTDVAILQMDPYVF